MTGNRPLVILSNRLPVTIRREHGEILFTSSVGGLATALRRVHDNGGGIWIGSPGETGSLTTEQMAEAHAGLKKRGLQAVELPAAVSHRFMDEVCNAVLWPLFHCLTDRIPKTIGGWKSYEQANQAFAEAAVDNSPPDSLFWIHDYHLLLVPALIRRKRPGARIGFFLHIPFPPPEIFRILPARREILSGLAAADVVGFQTPTDAMSFQRALEQEKIASAPGPIIRDYPISIDAAHFSSLASSPQAVEETRRIRDRHPGTILLGVDRLDYTKGIPRRLLAYEYFLSRNPALRTAASLIQVAVPSRHTVDEYAAFRRDVDELTGRINGVHATPEHIPLHYMHRSPRASLSTGELKKETNTVAR